MVPQLSILGERNHSGQQYGLSGVHRPGLAATGRLRAARGSDAGDRRQFVVRVAAGDARYQYGWPVPEGGSGQLTWAMVRRLKERGGTTAVHQQLVFRPTPGLGWPETLIAGLYLASSSAHPGGAVHGACGAHAARAALRGARAHAQHLAATGTRLAIGK